MVDFTNDEIRGLIGAAAAGVEFDPFGDVEQGVRASARRIRESPLPHEQLDVAGFLYEVESGCMRRVAT